MTVILTTEQREVLTARLAEAEQAYHDYRMGNSARVFVDQNGERVEYAATNINGLRSYILELKGQLGQSSGIVGPLQAWML
jgi:hypothetical protein